MKLKKHVTVRDTRQAMGAAIIKTLLPVVASEERILLLCT